MLWTPWNVATVQIDEDAKSKSIRYASNLQARLGRKVSFNETIRVSLEKVRRYGTSKKKV